MMRRNLAGLERGAGPRGEIESKECVFQQAWLAVTVSVRPLV
jgi:hypothetical protein